MDFESAYTTDRHGMCQMLIVYARREKLMKAVQRFYVENMACVRVEWMWVNVCMVSGMLDWDRVVWCLHAWLFNVNARDDHPSSSQHMDHDHDWEEKLCILVSEFGRISKRRTLRLNVGKSKVIWCSRNANEGRAWAKGKEAKLRTIRISGLLYVPDVTSGNWWRMWKGCGIAKWTGRVDDLSFFEYLSPFCFFVNWISLYFFHFYKILPYFFLLFLYLD